MSEHEQNDEMGGGHGTDDTEALLGAYVLDAVDDVDRRRVERLLATDPAARAEVDRLNAAADRLAEAAAEGATAPTELFSSLMAKVAERASGGATRPHGVGADVVSGSRDTGGAPTPAPTVEPVILPRWPVAPAPATADERLPEVASLERHAKASAARRRVPWILSAAAIILLFVVGGVALSNRNDSAGPTDSAAAIEQLAQDAASMPGARTAELTDAGNTMQMKVVVDPEGRAFVMSGVLPALDPDLTYQLWGVDDGTPVSLGLLGSDPSASVIGVDSSVHTLAITTEPAGGSAGPTTAPIASGTLTEA